MRRVLRIVAVNLGLLAVVAAAAELVFGGWVGGPGWGTLVIPKSFERRFDVDELYGGGIITYRRDEHGLRGDYPDPSRIDILTVGGSTTNEIFLDETATWSAVLAAEFRRAGRPLSVVNAGVDGADLQVATEVVDAEQHKHVARPEPGNLREPELEVLDVADRGLAVDAGRESSSKQDRMVATRRPVKQYLMNNSALYNLFRNLRGMLRARNAKLVHGSEGYDGRQWQAPATPPDVDAAARHWAGRLAEYGERLRNLARRVRGLGAEPIFVTQHWPSYRVRDGRVFGYVDADGSVALPHYADLMAHNRATMAVCREVGGICIDLAAELVFDNGDHYDSIHTNPRGSAKIGRYLYGRLKDVIR